MLITSELGGCALQPVAALVYLPSEWVTSGGCNPQVRGEYFAVKTSYVTIKAKGQGSHDILY